MNQPDFQNAFSAIDYCVVIIMLVVSIGIGLYHSLRKRKLSSDELEYLMAGRKMSVVPVSLSILASSLSSLGLLGFSTELYVYGCGVIYFALPHIAVLFLFNKFLLPIFHGLEITSIYHYLEKRFDRKVRIFGSISFIILATLYMPVLIYMPTLSFKQLTGIDLKVIASILVSIVVIYTCLGGFRATVWTDVFQTISMFGSIIIVLIKGYIDLSSEIGIKAIFQESYNTGRYNFPTFDPDPTVRESFWTLMIGGMCYCTFMYCNQIVLQRCLSLSSLEKAKRASSIFAALYGVVFLIGLFGGSLLVAMFRGCDPKMAAIVEEYDQIFPLLVLLMSQTFPSLMGIFMGGMFCASLSSVSTFLNSSAAIVLEDLCKPFFPNLSNRTKGIILRCTVLIIGLTIIPLITIAENTNTIAQFSVRIESITNASILAIFLLGIFCPSINGTCALLGGISSIFVVGWISFSANKAIADGKMTYATKSLECSRCPELFNITVNEITPQNSTYGTMASDVMPLFKISFMYYIPLGIITTFTVAFLAKLVLGGNPDGTVEPNLIWQSSRKYTKKDKEFTKKEECGTLMKDQMEN